MTWRLLECTACKDQGWTNRAKVKHCDLCAAAKRTYVVMRTIHRQHDKPTAEQLKATGQSEDFNADD